jgi:Raf kinase inhibitor-like YbhB/YbcL family protein
MRRTPRCGDTAETLPRSVRSKAPRPLAALCRVPLLVGLPLVVLPFALMRHTEALGVQRKQIPQLTHEAFAQRTGAQRASEHSLTLTSPAFAANNPIPRQYTGEGKDISPPLTWSGVPPETQELALICEDPDAPTPTPWVHWVVYGIPPTQQELPAGAQEQLTPGQNDFHHTGYGGPMPPRGHGVHHYRFRLYALDALLQAEPGLTKEQLVTKMQGHILAEGELVGTYERK